ncbi:MAG: hypothetical protein ABEK59_12895 [Halobacteria archaeon]
MPDYSRKVDIEDLPTERIETVLETYGVETLDEARERVSADPIIEVGREDDSRGKGRSAVIDPCPICGGRHEHKLGPDLKEGKMVEKASKCPERELYWIFWEGAGEGDWRGNENYVQEPYL